MITPGLIVYIIYYIKKSTIRFENAKILGKYHIHEGFVGIIFLSIGCLFYILRLNLLFLGDPLWKRYSFILLLAQVLTFAFVFLGNFFFFRDLDDVLKLKLINLIKEPAEVDSTNQSSSFDNITQNNLHFFKIPKLLLYPMGIMLTILSINMVIFGHNFLPERIFKLNNENIINLGYILCYIAASLIGLDWLRIYKKFYPDQYHRIRDKINALENKSV
jgi:hypothetical protein